jgi:hypothetical protein
MSWALKHIFKPVLKWVGDQLKSQMCFSVDETAINRSM